MKKYRVLYRLSERRDNQMVKTEEVEADTWRVDSDLVCLYRRERDGHEERVLEVPKARVLRINEVG